VDEAGDGHGEAGVVADRAATGEETVLDAEGKVAPEDRQRRTQGSLNPKP